jgi:hypothetical protein
MRLPQDRLHSGMIAFFVVIPVASLIYGWGMECGPGGDGKCPIGRLAVPVIFAFFTAAGLLAAFASLNTYCAGKLCVRAVAFGKRRADLMQRWYQEEEGTPLQGSTASSILLVRLPVLHLFLLLMPLDLERLVHSVSLSLPHYQVAQLTFIGAVLVMRAGVVTLITAIYGSRMQNWVDGVKESERDPHMPRWPKALFGSKEEV